MNVVIVDIGLANIRSVQNMFKRVGVAALASHEVGAISRADKLVLPGVGAFDTGMSKLEESGLVSVLTERALEASVPTLGICLGMQLMTEGSEEGSLPGLGWLPGRTRRLRVEHKGLKVPHMGWNIAHPTRPDSLFHDAPSDARYYFVHSYHVVCDEHRDVLAVTEYGGEFTSAFQRGTLYGTQFHPEKSHRFGMNVLRNFVGADAAT